MNFSSGATPTTNTPVTSGMSGFTFGTAGGGDTAKPATTGFSMMSTPGQVKPGLFGTGLGSTAAPQGTGFNFGTATNTSTPSTGVIFGSQATLPQTPGLSFRAATTPATAAAFGTTNTASTTGFSTSTGNTTGFVLGTSTTATSGATTGLTFGTPKSGIGTGFSLGGGENVPNTGTSAFATSNTMVTGFGSIASAPTATTTTTTTVPSFNLGSNATLTTTTTGLTFDASKIISTANTVPSSGINTGFSQPSGFSVSTATPTTFSFGGGTTTTTTTGFNLDKTTSAASSTSLAITSTPSLGATTTVTSSASSTQAGAINFCQLEESINKWTLELEEQEKVFMNQAAQVNAWDKLLITNGEKIVTLNQEVERVKIEQQQLEHELDYVVGQQKELQDCLVPLEKELASLSVLDPEREYTYHLAENLDTQLKQMSEDLKEIIEHLNEANRTQDSSDPIVQIGKILNAHMNSLQWLDQRTALLSQKIQQIDQMHQNFRQENERNFSLAYN